MAKALKKTGVNKGIEQGMSPEDFSDMVVCKKCGKDVEFTLGSKLFMKCPRCGARIERNLKKEEQQAKGIIKDDIKRRNKHAWLSVGFFLTIVSIAYSIAGFFTNLFLNGDWYLALFALPLIVISYFCMRRTRDHSASRLFRFYARLALIVNFVALALIIVTAWPWLTDKVMDLLGLTA
jgi:DNA-directed RNA polymerase subunit RPC12/RpoP